MASSSAVGVHERACPGPFPRSRARRGAPPKRADSWFVDFDPVRAKQQGFAPAGMGEATAAFFPDGFEESALGLVPTGWQPRPIYEMATYINGAAYKC